jgi:hypothetical protein
MPNIPKPSGLSKSWKFEQSTNIAYLQYRTDQNSLLIDSISKRFEMGYLSLYDDHRYTYLGKYVSSIGAWRYNEATSVVTIDSFMNNVPVTFKLKGAGETWMILLPLAFGDTKLDSGDVSFVFAYNPHFEEGNVDLLTYDRNDWRQRPSHPESDAEIKRRVKKHVDFLADYCQLVHDKERTYFEPVYLQSAVRFCRDGVGVESDSLLSDKWIKCFYDRNDALKGRQVLADAIASTGKYPEDQKTYLDAYVIVVNKMKDYMEKGD